VPTSAPFGNAPVATLNEKLLGLARIWFMSVDEIGIVVLRLPLVNVTFELVKGSADDEVLLLKRPALVMSPRPVVLRFTVAVPSVGLIVMKPVPKPFDAPWPPN